MTRAEFLEELRLALQGNVNQVQVNENLRYYENYIIEESRKGKTEEAVIAELGNPRLIARTIIDTSEHVGNAYDESYYEDPKEEKHTHQKGFHINQEENGSWDIRYGRFKINSWYGALLGIIVLIAILIVIGHLLIFLLPVIIVGILLWSIVMLFLRIKR